MSAEHSNGHTAIRWIIGLLFVIVLGVCSYLWSEMDKLRTQVFTDNGQSTRALLDERTAIYVPIILDNRNQIQELKLKVNENTRDIERNDRRLDRLEGRQ